LSHPSSSARTAALVALLLASAASTAGAGELDCEKIDCAGVLPGAVGFSAVDNAPYVEGKNSAGDTVGWVMRSSDIVDVKAYSGEPLVTLIGLDTNGIVVGAALLEHSEPILLVGIPERVLHEFIELYVGLPAITRVVVGSSSNPDHVSVDVISGATVTALAQNQTILKTAREVGVAVGVIESEAANPGHWVDSDQVMTWDEMTDAGIFGRLTVTEEQMDVDDAGGNFIDLWFTLADAPQVGRALLGDRTYKYHMDELKSGEHLLVVFGNGSSSFRGSAFVRGGQFDRVRLTQGMREVVFRDTDYDRLNNPRAEGAPRFNEGALFIIRDGAIDPGASFHMVFLGSRYDGRTAYSREFREFGSDHRMPKSVYEVEGGLDEPMYVQAWRLRRTEVIVVGSILLFVMLVFGLRRWTTNKPSRIKRLHLATMIVAVGVLGFYLQAQPSVTQLLTLISSVIGEWRWELFASAPLIFVFWIFIAFTAVVWGRGVFCGWLCPYGTMTELINKVAIALRIPQFEIGRTPLRFLKYVIFVALIPIFLHSPILGERLAEVEPFKSTFFVPFWTREAYIIGWWVFLLGLAMVTWRPFCRFLCPLGAGLAIFGSFRFSGPRRRKFCSSCTICTKGCEPAAIRDDGTIDPRECLSCMDCEASYRNEEVCPPLVGIDRLMRKVDRTERDEAKLLDLRKARKDV
jgi:NosR/NirI family nitrous oxide reductase transcriptional regulator